MITPAISVLSAVEGLAVASPRLSPLVLPLTCGILVALFAIQRRGTGDIGKLFGPVMVVWFATMAVLGIYHIIQKPEILAALSPHHGAAFFLRHGIHGMLILGSVVLAVTGGEALYADMGHFGVRPIRLAWTFFVLPSLVLGYLGQGALILRRSGGHRKTPSTRMVPAGLSTYLLVAALECRHRDRVAGPDFRGLLADPPGDAARLSSASDDQAHGLSHRGADLHPGSQQPARGRLHSAGPDVSRVGETGRGLRHRRHRNHGDHLDPLLHRGAPLLGLEQVEGRGAPRALPELSIFPFLVANLFKFFEGGYVPMLIGAALIAGMLIWSRGRTALMERYSSRYPTLEAARPLIRRWLCSRVPGTAVFLAPSADHVPPILVHHVERSRSLHETVVLADRPRRRPMPVVPAESRYQLTALGDGFYRLVVSFGYMEEPLLLPVLRDGVPSRARLPLDSDNATYYIGHETIVASDEGVISRVPEAIFSYLNRNAVHEERRYGMPPDQIVEIGTQIDL